MTTLLQQYEKCLREYDAAMDLPDWFTVYPELSGKMARVIDKMNKREKEQAEQMQQALYKRRIDR